MQQVSLPVHRTILAHPMTWLDARRNDPLTYDVSVMPNHSPLLHPPSDEQNKTIQQTNQPIDQWIGPSLALEVLPT
jgi:hypothetical protein